MEELINLMVLPNDLNHTFCEGIEINEAKRAEKGEGKEDNRIRWHPYKKY